MPELLRATRKLTGIKGATGMAEMSAARDVPRRLFDLETKPSRAAPRRIAEMFLKKVAPRFGLSPDLSLIRFDTVKKTLLGCHVLFQQHHAGKPISGAWLRVDIDTAGRVFNVQNDLIPKRLLDQGDRDARARAVPGTRPLTKAQALAKAFEAAPIARGGTREVLHAELMYGTVKSKPRLTWKIVVHTTKPQAEWKLYLDARYRGGPYPLQHAEAQACARTRVRSQSGRGAQ